MNTNEILRVVVSKLMFLKGEQKCRLLARFSSVDDLAACPKEKIELLLERPVDARKWNIRRLAAEAERDAVLMEGQGIHTLVLGEAGYPPQLAEIVDAPAVLFYRGTLPVWDKPAAAVVGTRKPSTEACVWARDFAHGLAASGICVVSGLALGIDAMAHRGALDGGGALQGSVSTIAVLGSGIDTIYPAQNQDLARRILRSGGMLCSEYPPGVSPARWTFPARNRIIAGLSRAIVAVEAPERSGALITAHNGLDAGRDVFVAGLDNEAFNAENNAGCQKLARDGAKLLADADELLDDWGLANMTVKGNNVQNLANELGFEL
jgi:DNA processing protein